MAKSDDCSIKIRMILDPAVPAPCPIPSHGQEHSVENIQSFPSECLDWLTASGHHYSAVSSFLDTEWRISCLFRILKRPFDLKTFGLTRFPDGEWKVAWVSEGPSDYWRGSIGPKDWINSSKIHSFKTSRADLSTQDPSLPASDLNQLSVQELFYAKGANSMRIASDKIISIHLT